MEEKKSKPIHRATKIPFREDELNGVAEDQLKFMRALTDEHYVKDKNFYNTALDDFRKRYVSIKYKLDRETGKIERSTSRYDLKTAEAKKWFSNKIKGLVNQHIKRNDNGFVYSEIMNNKATKPQSTVKPGNVYFFGYNPKHWRSMPFYDLFPLVLVLEIKGKFIKGLNLHYLPRKQRMNVLQTALGLSGDKNFDSKVMEQVEDYLNNSMELMDTDIDKFNDYFTAVDKFNELADEYNNSTTDEERVDIIKRLKSTAKQYNFGSGDEMTTTIFDLYSVNLDKMYKKIKFDRKEKRQTFLKDLDALKSDNRIVKRDVDGSAYPNLYKSYIITEGRIASNKFIYIPIEEYRFVVDLPGYWMQTDMKKDYEKRTATHTTRNYQY